LPAEAHDTDVTIAVLPALARTAELAVAGGTADAINAVTAAATTKRFLRIRTPCSMADIPKTPAATT
jgi:hypothetical protein